MASSPAPPEPLGIRADSWLSGRLGRPVFTVDQPEALREHATGQQEAMYQAKVPVADVATATALMAAGMHVVNVAVTLTRDPRSPGTPGDVDIREADPDRDAEVPDIAERAFLYSRFHLDPAFPNDVARALKREWAANCLRGSRGDRVIVAVRDGRVVGFLAEIETADVPVIDLIAVAPEAQSAGAGGALVTRFCSDAAARGATLVRVGTQAANPIAIRFYERLGWSFERADYDMHMHV